ncbi:DUF2283 domain-containing protein [Candidatus Woesearchaeota archaeon]|nr:DUF2283 domain-containing protein [Candidatus Woesearchaeota archaeon]MBW3006250.1 DUF2283 domain-containing protein [Candidatus Woesearchaeota archaeon]
MKKKKITGKGEFIYDYKHDILTFKMKDRNYKKSIEIQNFAIDIDDKNLITGIRVFDASKVFGVDKYVLKNIVHGEFKADVEKKIVTITLKFVGMQRNRLMSLLSKKQNFIHQITAPIKNVSDSIVECAV